MYSETEKGEAGRTNDWALGYDKEKHTMDLHAKTYKSRLFHLQIRCIRSCLEQEKKALGSPYHFPADQTLSRLVQNKKEAIEARIAGEKKYFDPYIKEKHKSQ